MGWFEVVFDPAGIKQGQKDARKASHDQANAIREQTRATVRQAGLAAEAAANQMRNTLLTEQATEYARTLLGRPIETVDVRLAPRQTATDNVGRRQVSTRESYGTPTTWFS